MISHQYRAIFVHVPKSAGTSVGTKLALYDDERGNWGMQDHRAIRHIRPFSTLRPRDLIRPALAEIVYRRMRDSLILRRSYPTAEQFNSYYKFTFVRNSWTRVHSWYRNVMADKRHMKRYRIPSDASFRWFVENRLHTLKDQLYYITDIDGEIGVDFIGRYENLVTDFETVCDHLGIDDKALPSKNRGRPKAKYAQYEDDLIEIVAKRYQRDIDYFGFSFEPAN